MGRVHNQWQVLLVIYLKRCATQDSTMRDGFRVILQCYIAHSLTHRRNKMFTINKNLQFRALSFRVLDTFTLNSLTVVSQLRIFGIFGIFEKSEDRQKELSLFSIAILQHSTKLLSATPPNTTPHHHCYL